MLLQNLSKLLDDPRRRSVILVTFLLLLTMIFVGSVRLLHQARGRRLPRQSKVESVRSVRSVPLGGAKPSTQSYAKLQMEHNKKIAEEAKKTGRSTVATIVDSFSVDNADTLSRKDHPVNIPTLQSDAKASMREHQVFMSQQQAELDKQQIQSAVHQQMDQLFNAWGRAPIQSYEQSTLESLAMQDDNRDDVIKVPLLIKAGSILQAVLLTEINSDEPSPVLAQVTTGDFKDARLIGTLSRTGERVLLQFHTLNMPEATNTLSVQALGVDESTARTSLMGDVDRHTLLRYGSFFSALLMQGVGMHLQKAGNRIDNQPGSGVLDPAGTILSSTGNVGAQFGSELAQNLHIPPTVSVHAGTSIGILFTADLKDLSSDN